MTPQFKTVISVDGEEVLDWHANTIVHALFYYAHVSPAQTLYTLLGDGENETDSVTAAQLAAGSRAMAGWLRRLLPAGARVILLYDNGLDYIKGLLGCMCAGMVPVSGVYPKAFGARDRFLAIRSDCEAAAVVGNRAVLAEFQSVCPGDDGLEKFSWIPTDSIRPSRDEYNILPSHSDLSLIQYTSGSTRTPRGVMLTHGNIAHNLFKQTEAFRYRRGDCGVNWLPLSHDMGLIGGALMTLGAGGRCILLSPEHVIEKPLRWLSAISRYKATLSGGPNFGYGMCARSIDPNDLDDLDLSSWEVAFNGAEYILSDTTDRFSERFATAGFKKDAFFACYGLAEATLLVTATRRGQGVRFRDFSREGLALGQARDPQNIHDARRLVSCGEAPEDIHVCITNEKTEMLMPDGDIGEIRVGGNGVGLGYINRPIENNTVFGGSVGGEQGAFLKTGDMGFVLDGLLYVTGRQDSRIVIGQEFYEPEDMIGCLQQFQDSVRLFSTVIFVDDIDDEPHLILITELSASHFSEISDLGQSIGETLCAIYPVKGCKIHFMKIGMVLKTPSGKVRMTETKEALLSGSLVPVAQYSYVAAGSARVRILKIETGKI